jgi:hypothetical protein
MSYQTQREKVKKFIENDILKNIENRELDYNKLINSTASDMGLSISLVEDVFRTFLQSGKLVENRTISLPPKEVLKILEEKEKLSKKDFKEAGLP